MTFLANYGISNRYLVLILLAVTACPSRIPTARAAAIDTSRDPLAWPTITQTNRPWTRWWWLGSAIDEPNLTRLLEEYQKAGIGGVEVCPIYGAHGYEDRFIEYLSPKWMQMLAHTTREAKRLDMGVDMTTGTGWPFGGPNVSNDDASARTVQKTYDLAGGATIDERLPAGRLQCLIAFATDKQQIDLASQVKDGRLEWTAPAGTWRIYAVLANGPVQKVKRAAPGAEGNVLDPFSVAKLDRYLSRFDAAFSKYDGLTPRSQFHDSYEYYNASWTDDLFSEFAKRRGYDLRTQLPAFFGEGAPEIVARVKCDYRETISDLHLDYVRRWTQWAHAHGSLTRDQAHGAPANLIDVYGAADIPETEVFARYEEQHLPMLKFSSSAAHLKGTMLASSESFTWLGEHFNVPLSQVKRCADFLMLSGVNHIFFHGIPYSPQDAAWPGWQFYAAVNFGPTGGLWHDLPAFNSYVAHCQTILQSGRPDSDVLLYVPFQDIWQTPQGLLTQFTTPGQWMFQQPFYDTAVKLWERGYQYDELSDRFLADAKVENGEVTIGGNRFKTILLPPMKSIPVATMRRLLELARDGATIAVQNGLPTDVPGFANFEQRRTELKEMLGGLKFEPAGEGMQRAPLGKGSILIGATLDKLLGQAGTRREPMIDSGLRFVRRTHEHGRQYFIVNSSDRTVDSWISLGEPAKAAALLDPMNATRAGLAALRQTPDQGTQVYVQLHPGESSILRTFTDTPLVGKSWPYAESAGDTIALAGTWKVSFIEGGPELPKAYETPKLASWTTGDDPELKRFAGTARYEIDFDLPTGAADDYMLDLGTVHETARVRLNGRDVATLIAPPFQLAIGAYLHPGANSLEVDVTNLAANRIADMDRRKVNWKYFYDANVSSLQQRNGLDASNWPLRDSGLMGPVTIQPLKHGHRQ
ncbi:MAG TPA: glycosyl hydrolase [Humisphaera sp.]|jgi:hypothetical protein|nr:glycosyl hydrolase [Humisphaera sp.]